MSFFLSFSLQRLMVPKTVPNFILILQFKTRAFQRRVNHPHTTNTLKYVFLQRSTILHTFCQYYLKHNFKAEVGKVDVWSNINFYQFGRIKHYHDQFLSKFCYHYHFSSNSIISTLSVSTLIKFDQWTTSSVSAYFHVVL